MDDQTIAELTSVPRRASFERFADSDLGEPAMNALAGRLLPSLHTSLCISRTTCQA